MPKIAVILSPGFADWEYALIGGTGGPFYGLEVQYYATTPGRIRSQGGLTCIVEDGVGEIEAWKPDAVVVVGGTVWETDAAPEISSVVRTQRSRGGVVAGICGGTLPLARAGLLDDVSHTSNEAAFLTAHATGYGGAAYYRPSSAAVMDDGIVTAPGTAPSSFTAAVFACVGVDADAVAQFRGMMAAEHNTA